MTEKICRVCGNKYTACKNAARNPKNTTFRWQEIACSPECGSEYFRLIQLTRTGLNINSANGNFNETIDGEEIIDSIFNDIEPDEFGNSD